ncbi:MAG: hypothetical protein MUF53_03670 [Gemmatimonadaceae bacterium]|nr:hypothetical protein [Gemmatimonadaceae bacterium]
MLPLLALVASCQSSSEPGRVCTEIGCNSGLRIDLSSALPEGSRLEVFEVATPTQIRTVPCTASQRCEQFVFLVDYQPTGPIQIRIVTPTRTVTGSAITPVFQTTTPNGPDCPPSCRQARVNAPVAPA